MAFLSDIGNFFHAIGNFVTGSDNGAPTGVAPTDPNQRKQNQGQSLPTTSAPTTSVAPQSSSNPTPQGPSNMINLQAPGASGFNLNQSAPTVSRPQNNNPNPAPQSLIKANPAANHAINTGPVAGGQPPAVSHASIWHDITHNAATNVAGDIAKTIASPFEYLAKADMIDPIKELAAQATGNQQAYNNAEANNNVDLGLSTRDPNTGAITGNNLGNALKKWAANSAGALLTVAAPGVDNAVEGATGKALADTALPDALKTGLSKFAGGASVGGAFNTASTIGQGDTNPGDLAKSFGEGALVGGTSNIALPWLAKVAKNLPFLNHSATDTSAANPTSDLQPGEVSKGVTSVNPTQVNDAADQIEQKSGVPGTGALVKAQAGMPDVTDNTPAYQRGYAPADRAAAAAQAAADKESAAQAIVPNTQLDTVPSYQHVQNIQSVIEDGNQQLNNWANDHPYATPQEIEAAKASISQQVTDTIDKMNAQRAAPTLGDTFKSVATNPTDIAEGTTGAGVIAKEALDAEHTPPQSSVPTEPTIPFNDTAGEGDVPTPSTENPNTPTTVPQNTVPTTGVRPNVVAPTQGNPVAPTQDITTPVSAQPVDARGNVAPPVETPNSVATPNAPVVVADPQTPLVTNTEPMTQALTPAEQTAQAAAQEVQQTPAELLQEAERRQAENSPNVRAALSKQIDDFSSRVKSINSTHDVMSNADLMDAANQWAKASSDTQLASEYANEPKLSTASDMAKANAALQRLTDLPPTEATNKAVDNIVNALETHGTNASKSMNFLKEIYGNLPRAAKVPIIIRQINKGLEMAGKDPIEGGTPFHSEVDAKLNNFLAQDEALKTEQNNALEKTQQSMDQLKSGGYANGEPLPADIQQQLIQEAQDAKSTVKATNNALEANQGDLARYVKDLQGKPQNKLFGKSLNGAPSKAANFGKSVAELQKSLLLASVAGPLNDSTLSLMNAGREFANLGARAVIGKGLNAARAVMGKEPGKYVSKMPSLSTMVKGNNLAKTGGELFKNNLYSPDALTSLSKNTGEGRTGLLQKADGGLLTKFNAKVHATREMATNLTKGIGDVKVQQMAEQEGRQAGFRGGALKAYTALRSANPTRLMQDQGTKLAEEVNNMNDNPLSRALGSRGSGLSKIPGVGPLIQNLWQPFSQWVGSQGWNAITDQNVVANLAKTIASVAKGDSQGAIDNLAKLGVNGVGGITAGYALANAGILTTSKGTSSTTSSGLYIHLPGSNNYTPVTFLGGAAPSLMMGYAAHTAMHSTTKGSLTEHIVNSMGQLGMNTVKAYAGGTPIGGTNSLVGPYGVVTQAGQLINPPKTGAKVTPAGFASNLATDEAGMFIPGVASDANAALNQNIIGTNPSRDAAQTTVKTLNPATGNMDNNTIKGNEAYLESRIPGFAQTMPRNPAKAAENFESRYTRGNNTGQTQIQAAQLQKSQLSGVQQDLKDGIPVYGKNTANVKTAGLPKGYSFKNVVNNDIQGQHYQKAIDGLQSELKTMNNSKTVVPPSTKQPIQDQIKQLSILQKYNVPPSLMNTYAKTDVTQWRALATTNPTLYNQLYNLDQIFASNGIASSTLSKAGSSSNPKYTPAKGSSSSSSASKLATYIKSNKIGARINPTQLNFSLTQLGKYTPIKMPEVKLTPPDGLVKPRKIVVSHSHGSYN